MLPTRLGPYRIVRKVGRGGMGTVFLGVDDSSGQTAAVKLLAAEMGQQADFRERFKAEIETLRKLNHPNIVRIFGFGEDGEQIFYAMEFVAGSSLEEQLGRGRAFAWREVAQFGIAIARALRHAHDRGVIHRDIKPGNLLLTEAGVLKLSDFGIARLFGGGRLTGAGNVLGTAEFMAPEQAEGRAVDPRSDLYSLGGVLYVLLARRPLYNARSFIEMLDKQRFEKPAPLGQFAADIPAELEQIVHRLLEKDPERRFSTAMVLERRLETLLESCSAPPPADGVQVTIDPPPVDSEAGLALPPIDPFAQTVASTHAPEYPALPIVPPPVESSTPEHRLPEGGGNMADDNLGGSGLAAAALGAAEPSRPSRRFVPVRPGELDTPPSERDGGTWISLQTGALVIGLLAVLLLAWYMLQPPSADGLYRRIQRQTEGDSAESLLQAADDIHQFLTCFPDDPRSEVLKDYAERIDLSRLERRLELHAKGLTVQTPLSPVERTYLDALSAARVDLETGLAKFQAMIDLFQSPQNVSEPSSRCIELAKRRLSELRRQYDVQSQEQRTLLRERINRADELRKSDPQQAKAIYHAVITLYERNAWAKELVERARAALEKGP